MALEGRENGDEYDCVVYEEGEKDKKEKWRKKNCL